MKLSTTLAVCAAAVLLAAASLNASAATLDMAFVSVNPGATVSINTPATTGYFNTTAGQFNWNVTNQNPNISVSALIPVPNLKTFCIDVDQGVSSSSHTYSLLGPGFGAYVMPYNNGTALQQLFNKFYTGVGNDTTMLAGFQVAVWEIVNDSSISLT